MVEMPVRELSELLTIQNILPLGSTQTRLLLEYYERVLEGNKRQNLTRLVSPADFFFGHLIDVFQFVHLGWLHLALSRQQGMSSVTPFLDLGSGAGVPGLVAAILTDFQWVLAESEGNKAQFLQECVQNLGLEDRVTVFRGRAEEYLKTHAIGGLTVRAVGPIERLYSWIRSSSTWNELFLFKGPAWNEEWINFSRTKRAAELKINKEYSYVIQPKSTELPRNRRIIWISRT